MTPDRVTEAQFIFDQARRLEGEERQAYLQDACGDRDGLRDALCTLLADDPPSDFITAPLLDPDRRPQKILPGTEFLNRRIGPFTIRRVVGHGGMGLVFEATQDRPARTVALKLLPRGATATTAERLRREAELLGSLHHPGIAEVYACDRYELGGLEYPCLAMEYVPGARTILEHCREHDRGVNERLDLFAQVCDAVHYGHQHGIIHRDLKPANILVDSNGRPRVIDFGIARCLAPSDATLYTTMGEFSGTLPYMSPEQVAGDPRDLDVRSDVYTLGVVLYELLTGRLPYTPAAPGAVPWIDTIRRAAPEPPSKLDPRLRGDLETILAAALEKDRDRRYQSADELAQEIRRYLRHEPLRRRPPTIRYLLKKRFQQNPWRITAAVLGIIALFAAVVGGIVWREAHIAIAEADRAREAEARAELTAYGQALTTADAAIRSHDAGEARAALARAREDLRGFEWDYLNTFGADQSAAILATLPIAPRTSALSPDRTRLAVLLARSVIVFDLAGGAVRRRRELDLEYPALSSNSSAAFQTNDHLLIGATIDSRKHGRLTLVDLSSSAGLVTIGQWNLPSPADRVSCHSDQNLVAIGSEGEDLSLWRVDADGSAPRQVADQAERNTRGAWSLTFSATGRWLASAHEDYTVRLWDVEASAQTGRMVERAILRHRNYVSALAFDDGDRHLASVSIDGKARIWDVAASIEERGAQATGGDPGAAVGVVLADTEPALSAPKCVAFDPRGGRLAVGSSVQDVFSWREDAIRCTADRHRFWREPALEHSSTQIGHTGTLIGLGWLADDEILTTAEDCTIRLWRDQFEGAPMLSGHTSSVYQAVIFGGGHHIASGGGAGKLIIWDREACIPIFKRRLGAHDSVTAVAVHESPRQCLLAAGTASFNCPSLLLFDATQDPARPVEVQRVQLKHPGAAAPSTRSHGIWDARFSSDGSRLAAATTMGGVVVFDVVGATLERPLHFRSPETTLREVRFLHPDDRFLLVAGCDFTDPVPGGMHVLDLETGTWQPVLDESVSSLAQHGDLVAAGTPSGTIQLFRVLRPAGGVEFDLLVSIDRAHDGMVSALAFHPTDGRLYSGGYDNAIKVWDPLTGIWLAQLRRHEGAVRALDFDDAGTVLASASGGDWGRDNVVHIWERRADPDVQRRRGIYARARVELDELMNANWPSVDAVRDAFATDERIPLAARNAGLEHFEMLIESPDWILQQAESILERPNADPLTPEDLQGAATWADLALKLAPEFLPALETRLDIAERLATPQETRFSADLRSRISGLNCRDLQGP